MWGLLDTTEKLLRDSDLEVRVIGLSIKGREGFVVDPEEDRKW